MQDQPSPVPMQQRFQAAIEEVLIRFEVAPAVGMPSFVLADHMVRSLAVLQHTSITMHQLVEAEERMDQAIITPHQGIVVPH